MRKKIEFMADRIEAVLSSHKIPARVIGGTVTPRWICFQVLPAIGAKISKIKGLSEELAAALDVPNCRVSRRGAAVAVEIPRDDPQPVRLLPLLEQMNGQIPEITATLGLAEDGAPLLIRLPSPDVAHILVAGTTGSGKTVLLQAMILSLALANRPDDVMLVLVDPKGSAFSPFEGLPHLARTVIHDLDETVEALRSLVHLMERRSLPRERRRAGEGASRVVLVIDEMADLLMVGGRDVQWPLTRLTQRGREAGIHVVAATQKPTAAVLGPLVKANFPVRLVGRVTSTDDARTATGWSGTGAERLMGRGDFLSIAEGRAIRFQAAHVSPEEIEDAVARLAQGEVLSSSDPSPVALSLPWPVNQLVEAFRSQPGSDERRRAGAEFPPVIVLPRPQEPALPVLPVLSAVEGSAVEGSKAEGPAEVNALAHRLQAMDWDPANSYRDACRTLGEIEGGGRFYLVQEAVDLLRATATAPTSPAEGGNGQNPPSPDGSSSAVAAVAAPDEEAETLAAEFAEQERTTRACAQLLASMGRAEAAASAERLADAMAETAALLEQAAAQGDANCVYDGVRGVLDALDELLDHHEDLNITMPDYCAG